MAEEQGFLGKALGFLGAPSGIGTLLGVGQGIYGALQRRAARKRREQALANFRYDIPSAYDTQLQLAQEQASQRGIAGQDLVEAQMERDAAQMLSQGERVSESASDILGLYGQTYAKKQDAYTRMLQMGAQEEARRKAELGRAVNLYADAQQQQFHYNRYLPFLQQMGMAGQQSAAGAQNLAAGLQTAYQGWSDKYMMDAYRDIYDKEV